MALDLHNNSINRTLYYYLCFTEEKIEAQSEYTGAQGHTAGCGRAEPRTQAAGCGSLSSLTAKPCDHGLWAQRESGLPTKTEPEDGCGVP